VRVEITHPLKATMRTTHLDVKWDNERWKMAISTGHAGGAHMRAAPQEAFGHSNILNPAGSAHPEHWHTHYQELDRFLAGSRLEARAREFARRVFRLLAEAEAAAHG